MSTLFRRLIYLFALTALLTNYAFAGQPAFAKSGAASDIPLKPDLVVTSVVFTNTCRATFTIKNWGGATTDSFYFVAHPLYTPGQWSDPIAGLAGGGTVTRVWQNVRVFESTKITVFVDPQNYVKESKEWNNGKSFPVPGQCQIWNQ